MAQQLYWNDLSEAEKFQATETYVYIRECEEERDRNQITNEYPKPIDPKGVECCTFFREDDGYITVII